MDYELCKKLKLAGFPQNYSTMEKDYNGQKYWMYDHDDNDYTEIQCVGKSCNALDEENLIYIPTLSELIIACGDKFYGLLKNDDNWQADSVEPDITEIGLTMEESVSRLWLRLNNK